jgi:4-hydroxyphenylpyruvate dioxygenase
VVDAEQINMPLVKRNPYYVKGNSARMNWSSNARACMYETDKGEYLPSGNVAKLIVHGLGYEEWVLMEVFSREMCEEGEHVPKNHSKRGNQAREQSVKRLHLSD